jgi:hypothetical protein
MSDIWGGSIEAPSVGLWRHQRRKARIFTHGIIITVTWIADLVLERK